MTFDLTRWGGSALTQADIDVPIGRRTDEMEQTIPVTYVPARNTLFLSFALSYAEAIGADSIYIGVNALDYSGYPDCRPEFIRAFGEVVRLGTKAGAEGRAIKIRTPLLHWDKAEIIRQGFAVGTDYSLTWSCYQGLERPCGVCDSCLLRAKGFPEAGTSDPALVIV